MSGRLVWLRRRLAPYAVWLKLAGCLALFTAWVQWVFVPGFLVPRYRAEGSIVRDTTGGRNVATLFALLPARRRPGAFRVVLIGDSSIGAQNPPEDFLPWKLRAALKARLPGREVELIDFSFVGLYAEDALLLAAKALTLDPDLIVYAVSPRVVPSAAPTPWATSVGDLALEPDIVARVGLGEVLRLVEPQALARTLVYSWWLPARLRTVLARGLVRAAERLSPAAGELAIGIVPTPIAPAPVAGERDGYLWPRASYRLEPPGRSTRALEALIGLCRRTRRCLVYHVPVNPAAVRGFEPGVVPEFAAWIAERAAHADVPFVDYRSFGLPERFVRNWAGLPDAIHPTAAGHTAFAGVLAEEVLRRIAGGERSP